MPLLASPYFSDPSLAFQVVVACLIAVSATGAALVARRRPRDRWIFAGFMVAHAVVLFAPGLPWSFSWRVSPSDYTLSLGSHWSPLEVSCLGGSCIAVWLMAFPPVRRVAFLCTIASVVLTMATLAGAPMIHRAATTAWYDHLTRTQQISNAPADQAKWIGIGVLFVLTAAAMIVAWWCPAWLRRLRHRTPRRFAKPVQTENVDTLQKKGTP